MKRCPSGLKLSDMFTTSKQSDSASERNLKEMDGTENQRKTIILLGAVRRIFFRKKSRTDDKLAYVLDLRIFYGTDKKPQNSL